MEQKDSVSRSVQERDVPTQELLLTEVGGGVVVDPQPEIVEYESEQDTTNPKSTFPVVVQEVEVATQELLLIEVGGGAVLILHPRLLIVVS